MDPGEISVQRMFVDHVQPVDNKRHGTLSNDGQEHQTVGGVSDGHSHTGHHEQQDEAQEHQPGWLDSDTESLPDVPVEPDTREHHLLDAIV
jgi:hypothetical protein